MLDVADDLLYDIFTIYVHIKDVCNLDSALCNKGRRPAFLRLVSTMVLLFNREEINVLDSDNNSFTHRALGVASLGWILKRCIHLASLRLHYNVYDGAKQESIRAAIASLTLTDCFDKLETIELRQCTYIKDAELSAIFSKCYGSVKNIDIMHWFLAGNSSSAHVKRCTKLEAFAPHGFESAAEMVEVFQACPKMRKVDLRAFGGRLTNEVVHEVAASCPLLEHFAIVNCVMVSDTAIRAVVESCPLRYASFWNTAITDATVASLCSMCPFVTVLDLGVCRSLTDAAVLAVAERLPGLTRINLNYNNAITSSAVEILASNCRELKYIDLSLCRNVTDITLAKIAQHCPKLEELRVKECLEVTSAGEAEIQTKCAKLKTFVR
jgi:bacterioferritin-associated ferredoxin